MYYGASLFTSINPFCSSVLLMQLSFLAALLFIVHFPVKYMRSFCHSHLKYRGLVGRYCFFEISSKVLGAQVFRNILSNLTVPVLSCLFEFLRPEDQRMP